MILDHCSAGCGWIAAVVGCVGFGSFGVPMKGSAANSVDVDPYVMQTYKSMMCFISSWSVLLLGAGFKFSPWGLLSGLVWVTGGTAGIFGIRNAGLAVSVGTWSGICVLISFFWGLFIFDEKVRSFYQTCIGIIFLVSGLIGMTFFSSPEREIESMIVLEQDVDTTNLRDELLSDHEDSENLSIDQENPSYLPSSLQLAENKPIAVKKDSHVMFLGMKVERYTLGLIGAATDGFLGGKIMASNT